MDYSIIWVIAVCVLPVGLLGLMLFLKRKNIIKDEELKVMLPYIVTGHELFSAIVKEFNLPQEEKIDKICEVVSKTLDYIQKYNYYGLSEEYAVQYASDLLEQLDITIDDNKIKVLESLIHLGIEGLKKV